MSTSEQRPRGLMRFRPRGMMTSDQAAFYSPQRDIAHIGPHIFASACSVLFDPVAVTKEQTTYMDFHGITQDEMLRAVEVFQLYFKYAADPLHTTIESAMEAAGLNGVREPVKMLIFSRVGQVITGLMFPFVRQMNSVEAKVTFGKLDALFSDVVSFVSGQMAK